MRKHLLAIALTLTTSFLKAQIVNIPDANFKNALLTIIPSIDLNNDKNIQTSEALMVRSLYLNNKLIADLTGIEYFTSLTNLECYSNQLTALNISKNILLKTLDCTDNQLTTLDVSKNTALEVLNCNINQLMELNVKNNISLLALRCAVNKLISLDLSKNSSLITFDCHLNELTTLDISNNINLTTLRCNSNQLSSLNVSKNIALNRLYCNSNKLTTLDLNKNIVLTDLNCTYNQLTTLDLSENTALEKLNCYNNFLTYLDVRNHNYLTTLSCYFNPNLFTICIDFGQVTRASNWEKDATSSFSTSCVVTGIVEDIITANDSKQLYRIVTSLGQEIKQEQAIDGLFIYQYSDGSMRKIAKY